MNGCTIVTRRELARARVLAATFRRAHPDASFTVLLAARAGGPRPPEIPGARVLPLGDVAPEAGELLAAVNPPAVAPLALLPELVTFLGRESLEPLVYLACGQRVLAPMTLLATALGDRPLLLVARTNGEPPVGLFDADPSAASFSSALLALQPGPDLSALLSHWPMAFADHDDGGRQAAGAWLERLPSLAEVAVLRDPGYGADARSLAHRELDTDAGGTLRVGGRPLVTLDLSEVQTDEPRAAFDGSDRIDLSSAPGLAALVDEHAAELREQGLDRDARLPEWEFERLPNGVRMTRTIRELLAAARRAGAVGDSPFSAPGERALVEYLNAPGEQGRAAGLTRLHIAIWRAREDLRATYPHIDGPDGAGFAGWLLRHGEEQEGLNASLLPPAPELAFRDADPNVHKLPPQWGVNVAGFFTAELGVGEAARMLIAGLDARDIPALPIQGHLVPPSRQGVEFPYSSPDAAAYPINVVCINGDGIPVFAREAGRTFFQDRHTIALWWWEVGEPPPEWDQAFEFIDEVWVASQHIHDLITPMSRVPVVKITLPVLPPRVAEASRAELGLPEDGFLFLFVHDYHSVPARKNPIGAIEAFSRAFAPGSGAKLAIKSINASKLPDEHERVLQAAAGHPDITIVDGYVSAAEKNAMIAKCDCYLSLHRAEGFGLTLAEAMLLGRPVIATAFGGTMEFTTEENSYLVDWSRARVGERAGVYESAGWWAEPDLDHAARLMQEVREKPDEARARARRARQDMRSHHSPEAAGEVIERRLERIYERLNEHGPRGLNLRHMPPSEAGADYPEALTQPPRIRWPEGRKAGLQQRATRPVADWVDPYLEHRIAIDAHLFDRLRSLDARVRDVTVELSEEGQRRHAETLAALRKLEYELAELRERSARRAGGDEGGDEETVAPG